jgi:signal transduction histidine kinase
METAQFLVEVILTIVVILLVMDNRRKTTENRELIRSHIAHELKTPIAVMLGTLSTLEEGIDTMTSETREELIKASLTRGREAMHLIDNMLAGHGGEEDPTQNR